MGIQPKGLPFKLFDVTTGPRYFRRWAEQSIEALGEAAQADVRGRRVARRRAARSQSLRIALLPKRTSCQ